MAASQSKVASMEKETAPDLSLHELIIRHPELVVNPLRWTARHLEILHCTFQQINVPLEAETGAHQENTVPFATWLANNRWCASMPKATSFMELSEDRLINRYHGPKFYFTNVNKHRADCDIYYDRSKDFDEEDKKTANLIIGFYAYSSITQRRNKHCYPKRHLDRPNPDAKRLFDQRLKQCTPKTWFQDPYLVCLMISLAQCQWGIVSCEFYPVRLIVCHDDDKVDAYVYYAEFPIGILDQLETPVLRTDATWPTIYYTKIPFEPYGTFADRITKALLDAKVGTSTEADDTVCKSAEEDDTVCKIVEVEQPEDHC